MRIQETLLCLKHLCCDDKQTDPQSFASVSKEAACFSKSSGLHWYREADSTSTAGIHSDHDQNKSLWLSLWETVKNIFIIDQLLTASVEGQIVQYCG